MADGHSAGGTKTDFAGPSGKPGAILASATPHRRDRGALQEFLRIFVRNRMALVGFGLVGVSILVAIFQNWLAPYDPLAQSLADRIQPPSPQHLFGVDDTGRDILSRVIYGTRTSLAIGVVAVSIAVALGVTAGIAAGYYGGRWDMGIMRAIEVLMTIPSIVLAIALISVLGPGVQNIMLAVGIPALPGFARVSRSIVLTLRSLEFVTAARVAGATDRHIMVRHLMPNALGPLMVQASLGVGTAILTAASLSFLGLGIQPPQPEWGAMLSRGRTYVGLAPHLVIFPGLAIALLVLGFNLLGDGLRDALDPRLRQLAK